MEIRFTGMKPSHAYQVQNHGMENNIQVDIAIDLKIIINL